jgi:serine protease inhibitor
MRSEVCPLGSFEFDGFLHHLLEAESEQSSFREGLTFTDNSETDLEGTLKAWVEYNAAYEAKLYDFVKQEMTVLNLDSHLERAKKAITKFVNARTDIQDSIKKQMVFDVNSVSLMTGERLKSLPDGDEKEV